MLVLLCAQMNASSWRSIVAIIADDKTCEMIEGSIENYMQAIRMEGKDAILIRDIWHHPDSIRNKLYDLYIQNDRRLEGAVFIGDIPVPMIRDAQHLTTAFKMSQTRDWKESSVPSDRFYDDFDLKFDYIKQDEEVGLYHYYTLRADSPQYIHSDIYSARIKPPAVPGRDKYELISDYLQKVVSDKKNRGEVKRVLHFAGSGYNSESINARIDEGWALKSHFPNIGRDRGTRLDFINFDRDDFVKNRLLAQLCQEDLDIAILHHHGSEDTQLLSKTPASSMANVNIETAKRFFRSKIRSSRDTTASKQYYIDNYNIPPQWVEGVFDPEQTKLDSIYSASMDLYIPDTYGYKFGAKFVMLDACFTGSFHLDDYISGYYPFNEGKTIVVKANSVNALQDIWSTELIGLLSQGVCVGNWAKQVFTLESHLIGDPTLCFTNGVASNGKIVPDRDIVKEKNNAKFWRGILNDIIKGKIAPEGDIKALTISMLAQNSAITTGELMSLLKTDPDPVVRLQSFMTIKKAGSSDLVEAIKIGMEDSYELTRRLSMVTAAKSGDPAFLELAAQKYFDPATTPREWFQLKYIIDHYGYKEIEAIFSQYRKTNPYWPVEADYTAFLKNQKRSSDSRESDMQKLKDESIAPRSRRLSITTHRNLCQTEHLDIMLDYLKNGQSDELRLDIAETMGWYLYSWRLTEIRSALEQQLSKEQNATIKYEIEKTLNRLGTSRELELNH